jgi:eukaryotic-like serine/threonine-protein kinase
MLARGSGSRSEAIMIGTSVGPYHVVELLGAGGMGQVYLARDTRLDRNVALKQLSDASLDTPHARQRLLREARAAAQITHPNIAAIYDILDSADPPCIVMEYVQGETLAAVVRRGAIPCGQALAIGVHLADALALAHEAGVIHRDLKPANVVLTPQGVPKILDFGLARVTDADSTPPSAEALTREVVESHAGKITGTPAYMAPEQLVGRPATPLTDVYGLGVMLFELLTGRRPFEAPDVASLALAVLGSATPQAATVKPDIPLAVSAIVARAMAKDAAERYPSAGEMAGDLRRAAQLLSAGSMTPAPVPPADVPPQPAWTRRRLLVWGGAAVVAAAITVAGYQWWRGRRAEPAAPPGPAVVSVIPLVNLSGDPTKDYVGVGISEALMIALVNVSSLTVQSRGDTSKYASQSMDAVKAARELGATFLVSGSVLRAGNYIQFAIKLLKSDGTVVWARGFEGPLSDLFGLQARAAEQVADALAGKLTPAERQRVNRQPTSSVDAYADYSLGRTLYDREDLPGNNDKAVEAFERAVAKDPNFALAYAGLGDACWAQYRATRDARWADRASLAVERAAQLDSQDPLIRLSVASVYTNTGKTKEAEAILRALVAARPNLDDARRQLAYVLEVTGRVDESIREYREAIALRPGNVYSHIGLGTVYLRANRYAEAAESYRRVVEIQPDNLWGRINLGAVYQQAGDNAKALEQYQEALKLGPDEVVYSNMGTIYFFQGKYADAAQSYEQAIRLGPKNPVARANLGDAYRRLGEHDKAQAAYASAAELARDLLKVNPRDARVLMRLSLYEARIGQAADARRHIDEAGRINPTDGSIMYTHASVDALAGRADDAIAWLGRALAHGVPRSRAREDDDLESIRKLPRVQELLRDPR